MWHSIPIKNRINMDRCYYRSARFHSWAEQPYLTRFLLVVQLKLRKEQVFGEIWRKHWWDRCKDGCSMWRSWSAILQAPELGVAGVGMDMGCPIRHKALRGGWMLQQKKVLNCWSFGTSVYQVDGAQCMSHVFNRVWDGFIMVTLVLLVRDCMNKPQQADWLDKGQRVNFQRLQDDVKVKFLQCYCISTWLDLYEEGK